MKEIQYHIILVTQMTSMGKYRGLLRGEMEKEKDEWKQVGNLKREALNRKKRKKTGSVLRKETLNGISFQSYRKRATCREATSGSTRKNSNSREQN